MEPACVALCPIAALHYEDYKESSIDKISGFTKTKIQPAIQFVQEKKDQKYPEFIAYDFDKFDVTVNSLGGFETKVNIKTEWSLVLFTLLSAILVGWFTSAVIFHNEINPIVLLSLGIIGIYLSRIFMETKQRPNTIIRKIYEKNESN